MQQGWIGTDRPQIRQIRQVSDDDRVIPAQNTPFSARQTGRDLVEILRDQALTLFGLLGVMWISELADFLLPWQADQWGIRPRTTAGLIGIPLSPFLHGGFGHLMANSVPFLVLGGIAMLGGRALFWGLSVFVTLAGGFGVWLLAPGNSVHIGASGLIFGYLGFLMSRGIFERSIGWVIVGALLLLAYGGMIFGVLPGQAGVSWQGHLFGFIAGIMGAWALFQKDRRLFG
jgi:membrane associated rhomboid family serine protease